MDVIFVNYTNHILQYLINLPCYQPTFVKGGIKRVAPEAQLKAKLSKPWFPLLGNNPRNHINRL